MRTEKQITRAELQTWLEDDADSILTMRLSGKSAITIKVPKSGEVIYLFGCESYYGDLVDWKTSLDFCGLYGGQALYLAEGPLESIVEGLTERERMDRQQLADSISAQVNHVVEEIIGNDRSRLLVKKLQDPQMLARLEAYRSREAAGDAMKRFFQDDPVRFRSWYQMWELNERSLLAYVRDPEVFVRGEAERYMQKNQEEFLLQFLENDILAEYYDALVQDTEHPIHRMRAITKAVDRCGGKTVTVTIRKAGEELTFKTSARSLRGCHDSYDLYDLPAADHRRFEERFGRGAKYGAEDIVSLTYGRNTIYEAPQVQMMKLGMRMKGM